MCGAANKSKLPKALKGLNPQIYLSVLVIRGKLAIMLELSPDGQQFNVVQSP